jgi:hypothetical protein
MASWVPYVFGLVQVIFVLAVVIWLSDKLMDQYIKYKRNIQLQDLNFKKNQSSQHLRLQACERLLLFLERISMPQMISRLQQQGMSSEELATALFLTVEKEFEHNVTQQLYVHDKVWQIIVLVKNEMSATISVMSEDVTNSYSLGNYVAQLLDFHEKRGYKLISTGQMALKEEVSLHL